jgi:hypothetical protein
MKTLKTTTEKKERTNALRRKRYDSHRFDAYRGNVLEHYVEKQMKDIERRLKTREGLEIVDDFWL